MVPAESTSFNASINKGPLLQASAASVLRLSTDTLEMLPATARGYAGREVNPDFLARLDRGDLFSQKVVKDLREPSQIGLPRVVETLLSLVGLVVASPVLLVACLAVVLDSPGSPLFRHERVGRGGRRFLMWKLRTMRAGDGPEVTAAGDPRVTRVGHFLRRLKLDELPQLWNVLKGEMSFVGPRPEIPALVDLTSDTWQSVLSVRPGITDPVALALKEEESLLAAVVGDREQFYRETLQPYKLRGYRDYIRKRTAWTDLLVILRTILSVVNVVHVPSVTPAQLESGRGPGFDTPRPRIGIPGLGRENPC